MMTTRDLARIESMNRPHVFYRCRPDCAGCCICDGGLADCTVCLAAEGELLASCPGYPLAAESRQACLDGKVVDLSWWRRTRGVVAK